jgi:tetratricopeptide (TPR) repeat protein
MGGVELAPGVVWLDGNAVQKLRTGSTEERVQAAQKLGQVGGEEAVAALMAALSDPFPEVQAAAAEALGNLCRQAQGDLWTQRREGTVQEVVDATTLRHGLGDVSPDSLVGMTLEFTSGPRKGERFTVSANDATELTVAEAVDFREKGRDLAGSTFQIGHPVSAALMAALNGSQWQDEALRAYEETIDTGGPTPDIHLTLARLYSERGQKAKALEHLDEAFSMADNADQYLRVARSSANSENGTRPSRAWMKCGRYRPRIPTAIPTSTPPGNISPWASPGRPANSWRKPKN